MNNLELIKEIKNKVQYNMLSTENKPLLVYTKEDFELMLDTIIEKINEEYNTNIRK
jgi:hypothetical protein